jgi:hypothetical protein
VKRCHYWLDTYWLDRLELEPGDTIEAWVERQATKSAVKILKTEDVRCVQSWNAPEEARWHFLFEADDD